MATNYYDDTSTTQGSNWEVLTDSTATSTDSANYHFATQSIDAGNSPVYVVRSRKIIVEHPKKWNDKQHLEYIKLVNEETETGWKVTLLIKGDIFIIDPDIEKRSMKDFIPLLKKRADAQDMVKINGFFKKNKID